MKPEHMDAIALAEALDDASKRLMAHAERVRQFSNRDLVREIDDATPVFLEANVRIESADEAGTLEEHESCVFSCDCTSYLGALLILRADLRSKTSRHRNDETVKTELNRASLSACRMAQYFRKVAARPTGDDDAGDESTPHAIELVVSARQEAESIMRIAGKRIFTNPSDEMPSDGTNAVIITKNPRDVRRASVVRLRDFVTFRNELTLRKEDVEASCYLDVFLKLAQNADKICEAMQVAGAFIANAHENEKSLHLKLECANNEIDELKNERIESNREQSAPNADSDQCSATVDPGPCGSRWETAATLMMQRLDAFIDQREPGPDDDIVYSVEDMPIDLAHWTLTAAYASKMCQCTISEWFDENADVHHQARFTPSDHPMPLAREDAFWFATRGVDRMTLDEIKSKLPAAVAKYARERKDAARSK